MRSPLLTGDRYQKRYPQCWLDAEEWKRCSVSHRPMPGRTGCVAGKRHVRSMGTAAWTMNTASKCMKQAIPADYTYNLDIPVSSTGTGKVYVNIFCAICNNDGDSLHQQEVSIHCDNQDLQAQCGLDTLTYLIRNGTYVQNEHRWDTTLTTGVAPNNCTSQLYVIKCQLWLAKSLPHAVPCILFHRAKITLFIISLFLAL